MHHSKRPAARIARAATRARAALKPAALLAIAATLFSAAPSAHAQVSFTAAIDLALRNSPKVKMAEADVDRARAGLAEARDVFIPTVVGSSAGLGYAYGFPLGTPTVFSFTASSLVFSYSQKDYIRSAEAGLTASNLALKDVREQIAEDTVNTYFHLDQAQEQRAALAQELQYATRLEAIVKDRVDAGQDNSMEYLKTRKIPIQLRLQILQLDDNIASYQDHLGRLTGLQGIAISTVPSSIPEVAPKSDQPADPSGLPDTPGVQAAYATAHQKLEQAFGDARYSWRPQISFGAQYSRFSTFNNQYVVYYPTIKGLEENAVGFAVNISVPLFDSVHKAKARETMADAVHAQHEADFDRDQEREGRLKLAHATAELSARAELASLDKDIAQQQLDVILLQLQSAPSGGTPITPKDEQNARIQERQKFYDVLDATFQLRETQVTLLRQTGQLESWLKSVAAIDTKDDPTPATQLVAPKAP